MTAEWRTLFALLPGYDPEAQAGDCTFRPNVAQAACDFFPAQLTHIEGALAGQAFHLEPWQKALVGCAFGWFGPDGLRRYREVFLYVPRKNGKTSLLGGLLNLVAFADKEPGAQIYSAAADREQATLVFRQASGMILQNPEMAAACRIYRTFKSIEYPTAVYKALSADADTKHGFNTSFCVIDELHAQPDRDLVDVLLTSTGSRRQPMVWYITTADFDRESICNEKHDYASQVRDNQGDHLKPGYDPAFLPAIYEASRDDDWKSPRTWRKANPNLGVSISEDYFRRECLRAQERMTYRNTFLRLHLNVKTSTDQAFIDMGEWDLCGGELPDLAGRPCYGGLDLSTTTDLSAFAMLFPPPDPEDFDADDEDLDTARQPAGPYHLLLKVWIPTEALRKRERRDRVPYGAWVESGFLTPTDGSVMDYDLIRREINELGEQYHIREIAADRWNATQILTQLMGDGLEIVPFGQGFKDMTAPTKELEKLVISKRIMHGGNPVLRWMIANTRTESDAAGNLKPSKKKSSERIDGAVATIMALGRALLGGGKPLDFYAHNDLESA